MDLEVRVSARVSVLTLRGGVSPVFDGGHTREHRDARQTESGKQDGMRVPFSDGAAPGLVLRRDEVQNTYASLDGASDVGIVALLHGGVCRHVAGLPLFGDVDELQLAMSNSGG